MDITVACCRSEYVEKYSSRDQTVRFAYVTSLLVEGKANAYTKSIKDIADIGTETESYKVLPWEIMFIVWTVYAPYMLTLPTPLITLPFNSNGRGTHRSVPTTVPRL
jgi:hypothetical protein